MKIWFDLSNSPHINLFCRLIRDLKSDGHAVVITCRPLANTIALLDLHGLEYAVVGEHYGANLWKKVAGYPVRVWQLVRFLRNQSLDVAVSQSSFHSPLVARLLGVRSIYMNDNEYALGNVPSFMFASTVLVPEFLREEKFRKWWFDGNKVDRYPGVKEGIYLWEIQERLIRPGGSEAHEKPRVYIRPEPWTAQYYKGAQRFLDDLILGVKDHLEVMILPRDAEQAKYYRHRRFQGVHVADRAMDIADIAPQCDVFVGAGGTMTREMAVLGVPTISVYQDDLLDVDRFLLQEQAFVHLPSLNSAQLLEITQNAIRKSPDRKILEKGRLAYDQLKQAILTPKTAAI